MKSNYLKERIACYGSQRAVPGSVQPTASGGRRHCCGAAAGSREREALGQAWSEGGMVGEPQGFRRRGIIRHGVAAGNKRREVGGTAVLGDCGYCSTHTEGSCRVHVQHVCAALGSAQVCPRPKTHPSSERACWTTTSSYS